MSSHLKGVVICVAGVLDYDADDDQWTDDNIKRWLDARGGKFVDVMDHSVTHLLCSRAAFKANSTKVRYAKRMKCNIVTYEWLDDAILLWDQLKKKAPTNLYHPEYPRPEDDILALYRKAPEATKAVQPVIDVGSQGRETNDGDIKRGDGESPTDLKDGHGRMGDVASIQNNPPGIVKHNESSNRPGMGVQGSNSLTNGVPQLPGIPHKHVPVEEYHIYRDPIDNFPYQVEVSRPDDCGNPGGKRWTLQVFESKSAPKNYRFAPVVFEKQGAPHKSYFGSDAARPKCVAMKEFEDFFAKKTGIEWNERFTKKAREQTDSHEFTYHPPAPGEPRGHVNPRYRPKEAEGIKHRRQSDNDALPRFKPKAVPSLKRKKSEPAGLQHSKAAAAKVRHLKRSAAFDDVKASRAGRL